MRVCIVTREDLFPTVHGAAVKIVETARGLSRRGADVTVVTGDRERYQRFRGGAHEALAYPARLVAMTRVPPRLERAWRGLGLPDYWQWTWSAVRALGYPDEEFLLARPAVDPDFWLRTLYVGLRHGAEVYQAEFPGFAVPAAFAARLTGGRALVVEHNVEWQRLADTTPLSAERVARLRRVELAQLGLVDDVIAVSDVDRGQLVSAGVAPGKVTVIPHGVDVEAFAVRRPPGERAAVRARHGVPAGVPLLLFHGTLHYEPNAVAARVLAEELLPRLERLGVEVRAVAAGMNPPEHHAHPWLSYPGVVEDLPALIAAADLGVVPLLAGGGTRLKILEYLAAGVPTVSTRKGAEGLRVADGRELCLVGDGDWDGFAAAVRRLIAEPAVARGLGRRGRRFARRFDWTALAGRYLALYRGEGRGEDHAAGVAPSAGVIDAVVSDHLAEVPRWTKPRTALVMLNRRCNLRCAFCDHWRSRDDLPREAVDAVIEQAADVGLGLLVLTGGEPFLRRDLFEIVARAREAGLGVNVTTNGTLIERRIRQLQAAPPHSISVSIDGEDETHDRLRGRPGTARRAWAGLARLRAETDCEVRVYFVVTRLNVRELPAVYDRATALGAGFDFWPVNGVPELGLRTAADREAYDAAVRHVLRRDPALATQETYHRAGGAYLSGRRAPVRCLGLAEQFGVDQDGNLVPCCVWGDEAWSVGSVLEEPLADLLRSERARSLRRRIVEEGCLDRCFNHSLHEFERATGLPFEIDPAPGEGGR